MRYDGMVADAMWPIRAMFDGLRKKYCFPPCRLFCSDIDLSAVHRKFAGAPACKATF